MSRISLFPRQSRLSRAVRGALAILALGAAASAWAAGAVELPASPAGGPAPLTVTVQPGQSLNDLAKAATQSHDPAVLARAGRALFDANPQAFMKRDPSRLKVGATLTVPALDATGAALSAGGASGASGASATSAVAAASGTVATAQHGASAPHPVSAVQTAPAAPAAHTAPVSGASVAAAVAAGASASASASAAHGASTVEPAQPPAPVAGASGPHVWSGAIQPATPSSASEAGVPPAQGNQSQGMHEPSAAAPVAAASQPRPSSLQQLLALKNRVLMELQKHGIGKPAATSNVAPAPAAPRAAANENASAAASSPVASDAAASAAASAVQPASAPAQPAVPVTAAPPTRGSEQIDWRPVAAAGAGVVVLAAGFAWRKRRKGRAAETAAAQPDGAASGDASSSSTPVEPVPPVLPETPLARDAAADVTLVSAAAVAAEVAETRDVDVPSSPEAATTQDDYKEASAAPAVPLVGESAPHDAKPVGETPPGEPIEAPAAPATNDAQHAALMQNAISALNSLDMPLPPRTAEEPAARDAHAESEQIATNGQATSPPPVGASDSAPGHSADQEDEFDWDPDAATPASHAGSTSAPSPLPPLGGAQFGALKLDFDLDLPSTPGAELPALTPEELARIARNKLDLASEYVELGDLSGARTLLQEVVDANDAATRDDARALLAKLAEEA
ncbi:FimV/HubP family polar landmark protein [Burkholderia territorii]|uniref:FimV/HubP family polar landmark protein n=1 Tax=Burkholderia territorii TaxID=1503055 RepID=UPI00075D160A|nr:FimV/HubP family polar landmark protein [Burkholderia territorii]KVQ62476.1 pilus assembly protein FimV [Burkholderia territorii]KWA29504.1 pilus assembly protein FimV [Burkholderia territorii]